MPLLLALGALAGCAEDTRPAARATPAPPLAIFRYDAGLTDWDSVQQPKGPNRISVGPAPGRPPRPATQAMRVEIRHGDVTDTGGYKANRSEVYGRHATRATPPEKWPDPVGSVRWYSLSLYLPRGFRTSPEGSKWLVLTQWKGLNGGRPPLALEIKGRSLDLGGKRIRRPLGPIRTGRWTRLIVGMKLSPDPKQGWVQVSRDGGRVLRRTRLATMDAYFDDGVRAVDPIYLKQGLYRAAAWRSTHVAYFGPTVVAERFIDLPASARTRR